MLMLPRQQLPQRAKISREAYVAQDRARKTLAKNLLIGVTSAGEGRLTCVSMIGPRRAAAGDISRPGPVRKPRPPRGPAAHAGALPPEGFSWKCLPAPAYCTYAVRRICMYIYACACTCDLELGAPAWAAEYAKLRFAHGISFTRATPCRPARAHWPFQAAV